MTRRCRWCGGNARGAYHPACAQEAAHWRDRGYKEDWMPDTEGAVALVATFWGSNTGDPEGSVRGDLRKGDWATLRWVLGLDESGGADFAHWLGMGIADPDRLVRSLLADWRPARTWHRCRRCGVSWDRDVFQLPSQVYCYSCLRARRWGKGKEAVG